MYFFIWKGVEDPNNLTIEQDIDGLTICRTRNEEASKNGHCHRIERQQKTENILNKNEWREIKKTWSVTENTLNKPRMPPITSIEWQEDNQIVKYADNKRANMVFKEEC